MNQLSLFDELYVLENDYDRAMADLELITSLSKKYNIDIVKEIFFAFSMANINCKEYIEPILEFSNYFECSANQLSDFVISKLICEKLQSW